MNWFVAFIIDDDDWLQEGVIDGLNDELILGQLMRIVRLVIRFLFRN